MLVCDGHDNLPSDSCDYDFIIIINSCVYA